ncbi:hypothetical protein IEQ34_021932 [Dendrobium chrysotoxum]|uniref:Uncharacterized protein n=1 Tax=Dendrobium chrysotoxum TaxID=161865 RepID=A0AAV7FXL8_DENCH|nr:hypothetical protein IEQ34_021932 [Dendrobium chrysotoxum]
MGDVFNCMHSAMAKMLGGHGHKIRIYVNIIRNQVTGNDFISPTEEAREMGEISLPSRQAPGVTSNPVRTTLSEEEKLRLFQNSTSHKTPHFSQKKERRRERKKEEKSEICLATKLLFDHRQATSRRRTTDLRRTSTRPPTVVRLPLGHKLKSDFRLATDRRWTSARPLTVTELLPSH